MYYISLDLEWNQAYAEKAIAVQKQIACRLRGEVIQIGAVKLDGNMRICGSYSVIVKPRFFKKIHRHVAELTGISQAKMDLGMSLYEAAESFRRFCDEDFVFLTWGPDDIPMLKENLHANGISTDWLERTYDLQVMFAKENNDGKKQRSLEYAMEFYGIKQTLPAHDALNDAYFTALVAQKLQVKEDVKNYHLLTGDDFLENTVIGDADAGDAGYATVAKMLDDPQNLNPVCPLCGKPLERQTKPFHSKGQKYISLFHCKKDGDMFLTLRVSKNMNETYRAKRTVAKATEEDINLLKQKMKESAAYKRARSRRRKPKAEASAK